MSSSPNDPVCPWCREPVKLTDCRDPNHPEPWHWQCGLRSAYGGLNHLRGTCSCCGGTEDPDPPGLSRREAAHLAADYFLKAQK